ncbi:DMT family transporter [Tenuibacillus multivorans]|uniref:Paired small multidrug resistance pump n=1 Tax=Tenuibacillus multivorans TaxID=237069 RepID=A0A1G9WR27_9BACI|nr:multidrug efflux SMR transporter [Tenuibacillus multivorans]GEL77964.1 QacE family quaternary ammonium compound efflux SMR transporter [Tenuibacillus multivorans]SDM86910.1 paired small multidrug resistance pump [Tenuibacillus multivorans]
MYWMSLILAGIFEMLGVLSINFVHQKKNWQSVLILIIAFSLSFVFLSFAMVELPMSTAYAVWTGIGAAGSAIVGMIFFNESTTILRILFISLIIASTVGLKIAS